MKKLFTFLCCFIILMSSVCIAKVYVNGYYRKDGTYVAPHYRSDPDGIVTNNYSYPGNYNPNTGKITGGTPSYTPSYSSTTNASSSSSTSTTSATYISNKISATIPTYSIKINGKDISEYSMGWTPLIYNDITYLPMTSSLVNALNLNLSFDNTYGLDLNNNPTPKSEKEQFMDNYIVILSGDRTSLYHKYGCSLINWNGFKACNIDLAKSAGYTACYKCN